MRVSRIRARAFAASLLLALAQHAVANDASWTLGSGISYTTGDYGTSVKTRIISIPFTARYESGEWTYKATFPYLRISGGAAVIP
ncbi:MAG: hypothetical protein ACREUO_11770, partial [Burkholderiales bacterium]